MVSVERVCELVSILLLCRTPAARRAFLMSLSREERGLCLEMFAAVIGPSGAMMLSTSNSSSESS